MPATPLTAEVLAALRRIGCPVTTTDLMRLLNRDRDRPLVVDQVYLAANALRVRGEVRHLRAEANKRVRYWEYVEGPAVCTCQNRGVERPAPTTAITGPSDAVATAEALLKSHPRQDKHSDLWTSVAVRPLAGLLLAASPQGNHGGIQWVCRAVANADAEATVASWRQAAGVCGRAGSDDSRAAALLADGLLRVSALPARQRDCVSMTMRAAIQAGRPR